MAKRSFTLDDIVKVFPGEEGQRIRERFIAATAVQLTPEQLNGMDDVIHDRPTRRGLAALREFFTSNEAAQKAARTHGSSNVEPTTASPPWWRSRRGSRW